MSMLSVDYRQLQQHLQKLEGELHQEKEKVCLILSILQKKSFPKYWP